MGFLSILLSRTVEPIQRRAGINLLEQAFEQVNDAQIKSLKVRTGMHRMDSTQIASNIVSGSRLQLLVEGVQRVERTF